LVKSIKETLFPDVIVVCGGVGLAPWMLPHLVELGCVASPYGAEAGLYGAAALAQYPSDLG
ncbi:MAG TPA: hypothetical protein VK171_16730, partial [Fimbriimonas sp.]|nr:hypothetical protein [Fimbriimonas sp.]